VAGNPLDPVPHLADGALDFVTGVDIFAPFVGFTDPVEGSSTFSFRSDSIVVVFSEAMDTSINTAEVTDGTSTFTATGSWSLAGTRLTLDVSGALYAARTYAIDFSSFLDAGGRALDTAHPYLGDGVLDFTMGAPTGESCQDALTVAEATSATGGVFEWVLAPDSMTDNDGGNTCEGNGALTSADGVIRYTKTTAAASAGGTALRVLVTGTTASVSMQAAALAGECDPTVVGTGPARLRCVTGANPQHMYLDVGPGDYYVWFTRYSGTGFPGATVQIEEVAAPPEGENCLAPYTTSTGAPIYTAPSTPDAPHVWTIPAESAQAMDHAIALNGAGVMACDQSSSGAQDPNIGRDAVIALPKATDTSIGWLRFEPTQTSWNLSVQLLDRCDGTDPAAVSLACIDDLAGTRTLETIITGAAGSRYLWIAADSANGQFPSSIVSYKEIEPGPGDSCATAIPITVGTTNAVTPNRPHRLPAPSCFAPTESVTWYRFTAPERFTHVRADGVANIAAIRAADGGELRCQGSAADNTPLVTFLPPGTDVCVAVASGSPVTSLSVEALPYSGNLAVPTQLNFTLPRDGAAYWMAATPTTLYWNDQSWGVLYGSRSGGVLADFQGTFTPSASDVVGSDAVAVGESIFSLDNTSTAARTRVYRIVRDGAWETTVWDTGSVYPGIKFDAITYDGASLIYVSDWSSTNPTRFFSLSPTAPGPATLLGSTDAVRNVVGVAADATHFYLVGEDATAADGVFRMLRSDLSAPPVRLATVTVDTSRASVEVDNLTAATHLYFRAADGLVHVIGDPAGASPRHFGPLTYLVDTADDAMSIDHATGALYLIETVTTGDNNLVRLD
jgi:hypothetical protein